MLLLRRVIFRCHLCAGVVAGTIVLIMSVTGMLLTYERQILSRANTRAFFREVTDWHRWLGVAGEGRATARMITGACNLAFLFLVVSGFYLWFRATGAGGRFARLRGSAAGFAGRPATSTGTTRSACGPPCRSSSSC